MTNIKQEDKEDYKNYTIGEYEERPWGKYIVTGLGTLENGEQYCEKDITVNPKQILSLQSHNHRREFWTVKKGHLTVLVNDRRLELDVDESVEISQGSLHCMANLGESPAVVAEKQIGECYEEDIKRYADAYGRSSEKAEDIAESLALYNEIREEINAGR